MSVNERFFNGVLKDIENMPKPGDPGWEDQVDRMRADIERWESQAALINMARRIIESDGRDFDEEFSLWQESKSYIMRSGVAFLLHEDVKMLGADENRRVRAQDAEDKEVKRLYRIWKEL